ncbi:acetyltransferase [Neokomagataea thailandica NBRC 106555]|nr:acetyltransferase [Neokomagataea thailandica NBRC 106555]
MMPEDVLASLLREPERVIMVLHSKQGTPLGFYELNRVSPMVVELAYFGLLPQAIGRGFGRLLLECAIGHAFSLGVSKLEVNTCTLDHPRALPNYQKAGFRITRVVREQWDVPQELIPERIERRSADG